MDTVGTNALASLNVNNLQVNPKNQRDSHCPHPNGFGYVSVVGYTDTSFSTEQGVALTWPSPTTDPVPPASFLHNAPNQARVGSASSLNELLSKGVAVIPAGHIPVDVKVDNNQSTVSANVPSGGKVDFTVGYQAFVPNAAPAPLSSVGVLTLLDDLSKAQVNSGSIQDPSVFGSPTIRSAFSSDYPLTITLNPSTTGTAANMLSGQVRVTILCVPVSGTTYA